jgi:hypothetical protein
LFRPEENEIVPKWFFNLIDLPGAGKNKEPADATCVDLTGSLFWCALARGSAR